MEILKFYEGGYNPEKEYEMEGAYDVFIKN